MKQPIAIQCFDTARDRRAVEAFLSRGTDWRSGVEQDVAAIIEQVRKGGDKALAALTHKFDGVAIMPGRSRVAEKALEAAWKAQLRELQAAIKLAARRIESFHKNQRPKDWEIKDQNGSRLTQRFHPVRRAGLYIPGGRAPLLSTVLMSAIPAKIAKVPEIVLAAPPEKDTGLPNAGILAVAWHLGLREVYSAGGAQAIAAMALGTETIRPVDVIVGPGNKYVAAAKKLLFGVVGIDSIAGPTDVTIVADGSANPAWVAADMLAQAEHDPDATAIAILIGGAHRGEILRELAAQTAQAPRREIIERSLANNGALISVPGRDDAVALVNLKAPEHLEIMAAYPGALARRMTGAAAVFIGPWSAEAIGDYVAGPNHTLPTGRTARFASPLNVMHFMRAQHLVEMSQRGTRAIGPAGVALAEAEQLFAHAESIRRRLAE